MDIVNTLILGFLVIVLYLVLAHVMKHKKTKGKRLPPGPKGLPLVGSLFSLRKNAHYAHLRFMKYGDVCTIWIGTTPLIALNTYKAIQAAFVTQGDIFSGRPESEHMDIITRRSGIVFIDGPKWKEHRRFNMRMLRELGTGKPIVEGIISDECKLLRELLEATQDKPVDASKLFIPGICNVIGRLIFSERCADDPEFQKFQKGLLIIAAQPPLTFLPIFAWLLKVPFIRTFMPSIVEFEGAWVLLHDYIKKKLKQHKVVFGNQASAPTSITDANNICEALIIEQKKQESDKPGNHTFSEWQLIRDMVELLAAGIDTTMGTLTWATLLMAIHPKIQSKVQTEIEEQVGTDRLPIMSDMVNLPYTSAVLDEIYRYSSIVPLGLPHRTLTDTELLDYFIPVNSIVRVNLFGIHHDPEVWERPNEFYPEHFLTDDGRYRPSKYLMPFSIGKRACLGESLARMNVSMNFAMMMQSFEVKMANPNADLDTIIKGHIGLALHPLPHEIVFSKI